MTRRGKALLAGMMALALAAGGLAWVTWFGGDDGEQLGYRCDGDLAVEEARAFLGGGEIAATGQVGEWGGHRTAGCSVWAVGEEGSGPYLRLKIRPRAAYRVSGAAEDVHATPLGHGWKGSIANPYKAIEAAVLLDCEPVAGQGLTVLAEFATPDRKAPEEQVLKLARVATATARNAAKHYKCEDSLGDRPTSLLLSQGVDRPVAEASGTCAGTLTDTEAARLKVTTVSERPAGALTESCTLRRGELDLYSLTAYFGPGAEQERYLDERYAVEPKGALVAQAACEGGLGEGYFKLVRARGRGADGTFAAHGTNDAKTLNRILTSFANAAANRHGCATPSVS